MIAAMTLTALDPFGTSKLVLFQVTYNKVRIPNLSSGMGVMLYIHLGLARL